MGGQSDPLGDVQEIMGLWHTNGSPNLGQKTRLYSNEQKKKKKKKKGRTCRIVDFAVSADHWIKLKKKKKMKRRIRT